ncbi:MAG: adenine deaminase [Candidatus Cyclobacteriaceae bacterium M3_2C_046]
MPHTNGYIVDIENQKIFAGLVEFDQGRIIRIEPAEKVADQYILPGFIDAHVHIESSMLPPAEFARLAVVHGTVATVSDPHEIANVSGIEGIRYMLEDAAKVNFKFHFGAPSCVPATGFETAGASLTADQVEVLFRDYQIGYLAEMMNWPGVLQKDPEVMEKISLAQKYQVPIDGHAPGLAGDDAIQYIKAGISTDHECFKVDEAIHKLKSGMKILIREGSAARNFEELHGLIFSYANELMFCSDDKHPDSLVEGHINDLVKKSIAKGIDLFKVLKVACVNPVKHYQLPVGLLSIGDPADFLVVDSLIDFNVLKTYINGQLVAENGQSHLVNPGSQLINNFHTSTVSRDDFTLKHPATRIRVIEARDEQLITKQVEAELRPDETGALQSDTERDILKFAVVNRYQKTAPATAFIKNFGLEKGAIASSVAHDSHNIVAVGVDDESMAQAVNLIIDQKGGIAAVDGSQEKILPLPIAGLMSDQDGYQVAKTYQELDQMAKNMGSKLVAPFMTLSFMALLVIPELKLSDQGLFDGKSFKFTDLYLK